MLSTEADLLAEAKSSGTTACRATHLFFSVPVILRQAGTLDDSFQFNTNVFVRDAASVIQDLHSNHLHVVYVVPLQRDYPSLHGNFTRARRGTQSAWTLEITGNATRTSSPPAWTVVAR